MPYNSSTTAGVHQMIHDHPKSIGWGEAVDQHPGPCQLPPFFPFVRGNGEIPYSEPTTYVRENGEIPYKLYGKMKKSRTKSHLHMYGKMEKSRTNHQWTKKLPLTLKTQVFKRLNKIVHSEHNRVVKTILPYKYGIILFGILLTLFSTLQGVFF